MHRLRPVAAACAAFGLSFISSVVAEPVQRSEPVAGTVVARKSGEEIRFLEVSDWRIVDLSQDVVSGDYLRTNATGNLAVLFADRTQMRLGRNTTLLVKHASASQDAEFSLENGTIWARAARQGLGLTVETPAAAAAIRGTDWTLSVDADGRTSLTVLEGTVELSNEFGSVTVNQGEGAVAAIGQAPTKIYNVNPSDREQMLFYLSLKGAFNFLPASPLRVVDMRRTLTEVSAKDPSRRTAEEWVTFAETSLSLSGMPAAMEAVSEARRHRLTAAQEARIELIEAMAAGADQRYAEADRLFRHAAPRLDPRRRTIALYGGYYARSLADPTLVERPPAGAAGGPYGAIAEAYTAGFLFDVKAAIEVIRKAEQRYPDDATLPAVRAQFALLLDDREQMQEAVKRALALNPDEPIALEASANYRAGYKGDLEGAYADLVHASEIAPGSSSVWNGIGLVQTARGATREAAAAYLRAIELEPNDPVAHANLAILYLDQNRLPEAKAHIDKALAADPAFDVGLIARGRYYLQAGNNDKALDDLLAGTTADPAYSQGLVLLAAAYNQIGDRVLMDQALDNADRLDPNDPIIPSVRTSVAIEDYEADTAIANAQEALRRTRARGGDFAALSASRDAGSTLNNAFRLLSLDAWGRYYGDAVFDPFNGGSFIDQSIAGSPSPFVNSLRYGASIVEPSANALSFSSVFQGLLLDPQMLAASQRKATLLHVPFMEASIGGGFVADTGDPGWTGEIEVQGYQPTPIPWSFYGQLTGLDTDALRGDDPASGQFELDDKTLGRTGYFAAQPTPNDRLVAFVNSANSKYDIDATPDPTVFPFGATLSNSGKNRFTNAALAWSHTFGFRNVANAGIFFTDITQDSVNEQVAETGFGLLGQTDSVDSTQRSYLAAVSHSYGLDNWTFRYGVEGGRIDVSNEQTSTLYIPTVPPFSASAASDDQIAVGRAYVDASYEINPDLEIEAGLFSTYLNGDSADEFRPEPRAGIAWSPFDGHYLRAGFLREASMLNFATLAPVGVVGLQSNQTQLGPTGYSDTFAAEWDAEWSSRFFTALQYQHQELNDLSIQQPVSAATIDLSDGRIDRISLTGNLWLGGGFGAFGTVAYSDSENRDSRSPGFGSALPFIPELSSRFGVTYVNPANVKVTLAASYVGERTGDETGTSLDPYWTLDSQLTWEPFDKRFALELSAYNLLDEDFEVAPSVPGWGRTFVGSFKVRF